MAATSMVAGPDQRYRKSERLQKRADFLRVQHAGLRYTTPRLVVLSMPSPIGTRRFGVTVSTKVGDAVTRNLVKRRLREIYRRNREHWDEGVDIVVIARREAASAAYSELEADLIAWSGWLARRASRKGDA